MSFISELKRRNVFKVAVAYAIVSWLILQIIGSIVPIIEAPDWVAKTILMLLVVGFPVALLLAWAFELTPEGIKKESDVVRDESITSQTNSKINVVIIGALVLIIGGFAYDKFFATTTISELSQNESKLSEHTTGGQINNNSPELNLLNGHSIAVLPFANRSNKDDDLYFTDGIQDDLLTQLAKISDLKVVSRTSVMKFRGTDKTIAEIAEELGVSIILEGGVQRAGKRIRINAQLINVATDEHLWADTYDREMSIDNLFDIQSEITKHIVTAIKGQLSVKEVKTLEQKSTNSLAAWEAYSKARTILRSSVNNMDKYKQAQPLVEQAVNIDPQFLLAQLLLAKIHGTLYWWNVDQTSSRKQLTKTALDKAIKIAPNSPEVLAAQGEYFYRIEQEYTKALYFLQLAVTAKPKDADIHGAIGNAQRRQGQWQKAIDSYLLADKLDPTNINHIVIIAESLEMLRSEQRLKKVLAEARSRFPKSIILSRFQLRLFVWADGDVIKAREILDHNDSLTKGEKIFRELFLKGFERNIEGRLAILQQDENKELLSRPRGLLEIRQAINYKLLGKEKMAIEHARAALVALSEVDFMGRTNRAADQLMRLATANALLGDPDKAVSLARQAMVLFPLEQDAPDAPDIFMRACYVLAITGHRDEALTLLEKLLNIPNGFYRWYLYLDPQWDFFRDDPRFNKLIKPLNFEDSIHAKKQKSLKANKQ